MLKFLGCQPTIGGQLHCACRNSHLISTFGALVVIGICSFFLRAACAFWFRGMIDGEGAEYARIAQNLVAGVGYVGIATEGTQLIFPPLFPLLIAAVSYLVGSAEIAGRVISVTAGACVVVPAYLIGKWLYGERVGVLGAALTAVHPFLVKLSSSVHVEPTYLTIVLMAIYMTLRAMECPKPRILFAMGALFGIGFLLRQEALAYAAIGSALLLTMAAYKRFGDQIALLGRLPLVLIGFLLVTGPYISWLSVQTGEFRIQGKTPLNLATESRVQQGMSVEEAAFGVEPGLIVSGIWMRPSLVTIQQHRMNTAEIASLLRKRAYVVIKDASATIAGGLELGSPFLFAFAILGIFVRPMSRRLVVATGYFATILALVPFGLLFTYIHDARFYVLFVPFLCIWSVLGIRQFGVWAARSARNMDVSSLRRSTIVTVGQTIAILIILLPSAVIAASRLSGERAERPFKQAVMDVAADRSEPIRIADTSTSAAFHARADFVWLPYCDESTALEFIKKNKVTHVILRNLEGRPYLSKWLNEGVPGARQIVNLSGAGRRFMIYEIYR